MEMNITITEIVVGGIVLSLATIGFLWLATVLYRKQSVTLSILAFISQSMGLAGMLLGASLIAINVYDGTLFSVVNILFMCGLIVAAARFFPDMMSRSSRRSKS